LNSFMNAFLSVIVGLVLGAINWFLLYRLYSKMIIFNVNGTLSKKQRFNLLVTLLFKVSLLFAGLYLVIVVFRFNVLYLLLGLVLSLICLVILLFRMR
jgi:hypothetical protein